MLVKEREVLIYLLDIGVMETLAVSDYEGFGLCGG